MREMPSAWLVRFPKDEQAVYLDFGRAVAFAAARHGVVVPLFEDARVPADAPWIDTVIDFGEARA